MKRFAILAVFALVMGTGTVTADPCTGSNCARPEPAPFQTACPTQNCVRPEPEPFQTACPSMGCARPEPAEIQPV